jgi:vitamin B12 transporter
VTLGGRVDANERFGTFATYRLGASGSHGPLRAHVSAGTGFKEPTFFENFATGFTRGNPELQPEESRSVEAGVRLTGPRASVGATAFAQRFRNLIQYTAVPPAPEQPNYQNVGAARARGRELEASWLLPRGVDAHTTYTLVDTEVTDEGFGEDRLFQRGRPLLRRPLHQVGATLGAAPFERTRATASLRRVGAREDLDFTDPAEWQGRRVTLPAHTLLDLTLSRSLQVAGHALDLVLRVENALDARYEAVYNFPAPGRLIRAGVRAGRGP